jgi:hypothetical protein
VANFKGPILFTAPHSFKLNRGGADWGDNERIHWREQYTSHLAIKMANCIGKYTDGASGSFMVWNKDKKFSKSDLDPNYLMVKHFKKSPFHCGLHRFWKDYKGLPLLHIDVHGKMDRKDNLDVDLGMAPMEYYWDGKEDELCESLKNAIKKGIDSAFKGKSYKGFKPLCEDDPCLHGHWGETLFTISH